MNGADSATAVMPHRVSAGHQSDSATSGSCSSAVRGVNTNPIAARCGSRLCRALRAAATRLSESPWK